MLHKIELDNFKKHERLVVEFGGGVTSITGENGIGKSCLLKGILFVLFGSRAAGGAANIWRWDAEGKRSAKLTVTLPVHGLVTITRTPASAKVSSADGQLLASGDAAVTKFIEESLGMAATHLRPLCYSPQGETQGILAMGPAALQQKVEGMAGVKVLDKVLDLLNQDITRFDTKLEVLAGSENLEDALAEVERCENFIAIHTEAANVTAADVQAREEELKVLNDNLREGLRNQATRKQTEELQARVIAQLEGLSNQAFQLREQIKLAPSVNQDLYDKNTAKLAELQSRQGQAKERKAQLSRLLLDRDNVLRELVALGITLLRHEEATKKLEIQEPAAELAQARAEERRAEVNQLNANLRRKKGELKESICQSCKRPFTGREVTALQEEIQQISEAIDKEEQAYQVLLKTAKAAHDAVIALRKDLTPGIYALIEDKKQTRYTVEQRIMDLGCSVRAVSADEEVAEDFEPQIKELEQSLGQARRDLQSLQKLQGSLEITESAISKGKDDLKDLADKLLATPETVLGPLESIILHKEAEMKTAREQLTNWKREIDKAQVELKAAQKAAKDAQHNKALREEWTQSKSLAERLQQYLRKNRSRLGAGLWDGLLSYASALVSNTTSGKLSELTRTSDGDFTIREEGRTVPVSESSGAQRSIIGLALRVALTKTFYGSGLFLLLDEPTADARDNTAAAVAGMLQSLDMQVISVTHRTGDAVNAGEIIEI